MLPINGYFLAVPELAFLAWLGARLLQLIYLSWSFRRSTVPPRCRPACAGAKMAASTLSQPKATKAVAALRPRDEEEGAGPPSEAGKTLEVKTKTPQKGGKLGLLSRKAELVVTAYMSLPSSDIPFPGLRISPG